MWPGHIGPFCFFFNDTATTEIYTLSLHDALPISVFNNSNFSVYRENSFKSELNTEDRKSTRLNSSHVKISYAVFCLKKKKLLRREHHPGVVDQHAHPRVPGPQLACGGADGIQRGQVQGLDHDVRARGGVFFEGGGALEIFHLPPRQPLRR